MSGSKRGGGGTLLMGRRDARARAMDAVEDSAYQLARSVQWLGMTTPRRTSMMRRQMARSLRRLRAQQRAASRRAGAGRWSTGTRRFAGTRFGVAGRRSTGDRWRNAAAAAAAAAAGLLIGFNAVRRTRI